MDHKIIELFIDNNDNIYVVDDKNILYVHEDGFFYPFTVQFKKLHKCFRINDTFYVHYDDTLAKYNLDYRVDSIDIIGVQDVLHYPRYDYIIFLKNNQVMISFGNDINSSTCHVSADRMKIVDDFLIVFSTDYLNIYDLSKNVRYKHTFFVNEKIYNNICKYDASNNTIILNNGDLITSCNVFTNLDNNFQNTLFDANDYYFWYDSTEQGTELLCYYTKESFDSIVGFVLEQCRADYRILSFEDGYQLMIIDTDKIKLANNVDTQIFLINNQVILSDRTCLTLSCETINFDYLAHAHEKAKKQDFVIDVFKGRPVVDSLINIIPYLYRLNRNYNFHFDYIGDNYEIISYGQGVNRSVYTDLRIGIDKVLETPETMSENLGKLIFFCNQESSEKFENLHAYFFFLIEPNPYTLFRCFKRQDYESFIEKYHYYQNHIDDLIATDLGISNVDGYVEYILANDLSDQAKLAYQKIVASYLFFARRHYHYGVIKNVELEYTLNSLIARYVYEPIFEYYSKDIRFDAQIFETAFYNLCQADQDKFIYNVTGSYYYRDPIYVNFEPYRGNLDYSISACEASVTFYVTNPTTVGDMDEIMSLLSSLDKHMVN